MNGTLALLWRSIRADAIGRRPHAFRIGSVMLILALLIASHANTAGSGSPGLQFFRLVSWLMAALVTLAAMGHFATSITEEKEEGTLGLLLMADLSPLSILLGKSTNRIFSALLVFAAQFPFALLAVAMGGITFRQILCVYLALSAYMFLMANLALLLSVISRRTGIALAGMIAVATFLHGFAPAFENIVRELVAARRVSADSWLVGVSGQMFRLHDRVSVFYEIDRILDPQAVPHPFTWQMGLSLAGGSVAFVTAWMAFRQIVWTADLSAPPRPVAARRRRRTGALSRRPWAWAFVWKDYYFLSGGPALVLLKMLAYPLLAGLLFWGEDWVYAVMQLNPWGAMLGILISVLIIECLVYSSQLFHLEQKWGTLPTLMMLPRSAGQIAYAKIIGCLVASLPTLIAIGCLLVIEPNLWQGALIDLKRPDTIAAGCGFIILCQLTVLCSLLVTWGALPLAVGVMLVLGVVVTPFLTTALILINGSYQSNAVIVQYGPFLYATGILSAAIQLEIGRRIHLVASS